MPVKTTGRKGQPGEYTQYDLEAPDTKLFTVAQASGIHWYIYLVESGNDGMLRTLACYPNNRAAAEACALAVALALEGALTGEWKNCW